MPFKYKTLGQAAPSSTANVDIYTVPSATEAIVSSIVVCNTTNEATSFRIFQRINGATAGTQNAIAYDVDIAARALVSIELKLTLDASDVISVRSATSNALTFTVNGSEID
jgi:hypothetical protein